MLLMYSKIFLTTIIASKARRMVCFDLHQLPSQLSPSLNHDQGVASPPLDLRCSSLYPHVGYESSSYSSINRSLTNTETSCTSYEMKFNDSQTTRPSKGWFKCNPIV